MLVKPAPMVKAVVNFTNFRCERSRLRVCPLRSVKTLTLKWKLAWINPAKTKTAKMVQISIVLMINYNTTSGLIQE